MELEKLTERIYYYPHQPALDRPMLAYLSGEKWSLAVDAGYSAGHVRDFYRQLKHAALREPDFTVLTHWHYDHTFGMNGIHGLSAALGRTNAHLRRAADPERIRQWREEDPCFQAEYAAQPDPMIVCSDIEFQERLAFDLGGLTAVAFHTEAPHSDDTVCVWVPEEGVLFLGDSICEDFFDNGRMDAAKLTELVRTIENTDCALCVLSHAAPMKKAELLAYLYGVLAT